MRRAVDRMMKNNKKSTFVLQLTAMVDMFTIMIVFLLKSYTTSSVNITPFKGMELPHSVSHANPVEALKLIVATDGVYVDDKKILDLKDGQVAPSAIGSQDPYFLKPLFEELDKQAKKSRDIASKNEEHKFEGKVVMQADARLDYSVLKKVMYTASLAGFADMKLATMGD